MCSNLVIKGNFLYLKKDIHEKPKANMTFNAENLNTFSEVGNKKKMPILTLLWSSWPLQKVRNKGIKVRV